MRPEGEMKRTSKLRFDSLVGYSMSWWLLAYDFPKSLIDEWQAVLTGAYKRWLGLA